MVAVKPIRNVNEIGRRDVIITISLALYVLASYLPTKLLPEFVGRVVLYGFLGITLLKIITKQTPLKITPHIVWLLAFCILGLSSILYAIKPSYVFRYLYVLFVTWVVSFSFAQYVQNDFSFKRLFFGFAYSPFFLAVYLFLSGEINTQGERLGQSLFGNANRIAMMMMISLFCISWFIFYAKRKYMFVNILTAVIMFYITALTGGRKYLLLPFLFFLLLLFFKNWRKNKQGLALYLILFVLVIFFASWAVINVPSLYNSVGVRFEGLISFLSGDLWHTDDSTMVRYMMISKGWDLFLQEPVLGYGLDHFSLLISIYLDGSYAHNNYIELMVDLGLIGLFVYYSFYAYLIIKLIRIRDDVTGLRNFFLAYMLVLLVFEIGNVTYQYLPIQIFIGLASAYVWLYENSRGKIAK